MIITRILALTVYCSLTHVSKSLESSNTKYFSQLSGLTGARLSGSVAERERGWAVLVLLGLPCDCGDTVTGKGTHWMFTQIPGADEGVCVKLRFQPCSTPSVCASSQSRGRFPEQMLQEDRATESKCFLDCRLDTFKTVFLLLPDDLISAKRQHFRQKS